MLKLEQKSTQEEQSGSSLLFPSSKQDSNLAKWPSGVVQQLLQPLPWELAKVRGLQASSGEGSAANSGNK